MKGFWIEFEDGSSGYCEGESAYDALKIAEKLTGKKVIVEPGYSAYDPKLKPLPYPSSPVIWQFDHPVNGKTPTFCFRPEQCAGCTSCPQRLSCTE